MVSVDSYFDESGTHEGSLIVVVAGFADFSNRWLDFSIEWGKVLEKEPSIKYFHSFEANNRCGQFEGWDRPKRDAKVIALIDVINDSKAQPLLSSVRGEDYKRILAQFPGVLPEDPYIFCISNLFVECSDVAKAIEKKMIYPETIKVSLNFENNEEMESKARAAYKFALENNPQLPRVLAPTISYLPKVEYRPLQAADALAYDSNKEFTKSLMNPSAPMRRSLEAILSRAPLRGFSWPWDYESLRKLVERMIKQHEGAK